MLGERKTADVDCWGQEFVAGDKDTQINVEKNSPPSCATDCTKKCRFNLYFAPPTKRIVRNFSYSSREETHLSYSAPEVQLLDMIVFLMTGCCRSTRLQSSRPFCVRLGREHSPLRSEDRRLNSIMNPPAPTDLAPPRTFIAKMEVEDNKKIILAESEQPKKSSDRFGKKKPSNRSTPENFRPHYGPRSNDQQIVRYLRWCPLQFVRTHVTRPQQVFATHTPITTPFPKPPTQPQIFKITGLESFCSLISQDIQILNPPHVLPGAQRLGTRLPMDSPHMIRPEYTAKCRGKKLSTIKRGTHRLRNGRLRNDCRLRNDRIRKNVTRPPKAFATHTPIAIPFPKPPIQP